jgi:hypothetical protein
MSRKTKNEILGMPCVVNHNNKKVYIKCSSAITAMGIASIVKQYYPGYKGHLVSLERLEEIRDSLETVH